MGENPVASFPQPELVREALSSLGCLVVSDVFLSETARLASVVLPAASFAEKDGTFTNFEGRVQRVRKAIEPAGESLPDSEIVMRLAGKMDLPIAYSSPQQVMEEIKELVPFYRYFEYTNVDTLSLDLNEAGSNTPGTRRLYKGLFPDGFGRFTPVEYTPPQGINMGKYPFMLMAGSGQYQFGDGSRSSRSARLKQFSPEAFLEINPADASENDIGSGDRVTIISAQGELSARARVMDTLPRGLLFMPISYPAHPVYGLFSPIIDRRTGAPTLKTCYVMLQRITGND
ncbi:MAG: hypothetical protein A2Y92_02250 [Chloroflexi bacterium RBG_13_57_8]|nr:MAG: hypothetical protein A2Y92_02250 [Chloroflexi bacterium RBG_13_57_8]